MKIKINSKDNLFIILSTLLIGTNFLGLYLLQAKQSQLIAAKNKASWEARLAKEGISPVLLEENQKIEAAFPNEQEVIQFITNLNKDKSQFKKFSLNFETEEPKAIQKYKYLPFTLELSGNRKDISQLLTKLWNIPYIIEINSLEMADQLTDPNLANVLMKASLYVKDAFAVK